MALLAAAFALAVALPGCLMHSDDEFTKGVIAGERPVAMEGADTFFGGKVTAKVTVSRGIGRGLKRGGRARDSATYADSEGKDLVGSPLPPVTLHLIITNNGADPVSVKLIDFNSDLGNFVLDPDLLAIAPGQAAEPTTMVSQLGVTADEMPFKVTLRLAGAKETKTFLVKSVAEPAPAPGK